MIITSLQNPTVKRLVGLQRKRRDRDEAGLAPIEGHDELETAVAHGLRPAELYYCPELMGASADASLLKRVRGLGAEITEVSREVFEKIAYREGPDGWLAVGPMPKADLGSLVVGPAPLVLVAEGIEKPGNLGAMVRTAVAAGAQALVLVDGVSDVGNPNVVRASKGAVFVVPVVACSRDELLRWLGEKRIRLVAAVPRAEMVMWEADLAVGGVAIAIGSEHEGLSQELMAAAQARVQIPMVGEIDSLNASVSAALLLYEAMRQRRGERG